MDYEYQQTIKHQVSVSGVTLNSGNLVTVKLSPAPVDHGILFYLNNGKCYSTIETNSCSISDCVYSTNTTNGHAIIHTIEHLLSALHSLRIDNIKITVIGDDEIPIMNGSSEQYYYLLQAAGTELQTHYRNYIQVPDKTKVRNGDKWICIEPYDGLVIDVTIDFPHPLIGAQRFVFDVFNDDYYKEIAKARTFGFYDYIKKMQDNGYFKGGDINTAIILDETSILSSPLKWENEFVRHKTLDLIGDLYVGGAIKGYVKSYCSGHELNNKLMRKIDEKFNKQIPEIPTKCPYREGDA